MVSKIMQVYMFLRVLAFNILLTCSLLRKHTDLHILFDLFLRSPNGDHTIAAKLCRAKLRFRRCKIAGGRHEQCGFNPTRFDHSASCKRSECTWHRRFLSECTAIPASNNFASQHCNLNSSTDTTASFSSHHPTANHHGQRYFERRLPG